MKIIKILLLLAGCLFAGGLLQAQVQYELTYDLGTETYTVSITSGTAYSGGFARMSSSTQIISGGTTYHGRFSNFEFNGFATRRSAT